MYVRKMETKEVEKVSCKGPFVELCKEPNAVTYAGHYA